MSGIDPVGGELSGDARAAFAGGKTAADEHIGETRIIDEPAFDGAADRLLRDLLGETVPDEALAQRGACLLAQ